MGMGFAPRYMGMTIAQFCADPDDCAEVTFGTMDRLGADVFDAVNALPCGRIGPALTSLWLSRIAIPGRDLPEDGLWQVLEHEVMTLDDYDTILDVGWPEFLERYLPRVIDMDELDASRSWVRDNVARVRDDCHARGYVPISFGAISIPFEYLCGGRSMRTFFLDLYRNPAKVKAVMDVMMPHIVQTGLGIVRLSGIPAIWVGGWRSASAMLAPKIWNEFVFPYFCELVNALAEHGILSVLHLDQDWTRDLARLQELPAKMCLLNPDGMTDIREAKAILGDRMAIMGDVPSPLLATGTPDDIFLYVRDLIRDIGPTGFILCPGCDAPINARPENMEAMIAASEEYGRCENEAAG
jgi:uroporphyrinogen-III decarboxylase